MLIGGMHKTSMVDFPGHIATTLFFYGCNFRCGFCHNPELVNQKPTNSISIEDVFTQLDSRKHLVNAVCITGGEPLIYPEVYDFIKELKEKGFLVKLDTNGYNPQLLQKLIDDNLLDFVAMDIKGPISKYYEITETKNLDTNKIIESIKIINSSNIDSEYRTTVLPNLIQEDFKEINLMLNGAKKHVLQQFNPSHVLNQKYASMIPLTENQIKALAEELVDLNVEFRI